MGCGVFFERAIKLIKIAHLIAMLNNINTKGGIYPINSEIKGQRGNKSAEKSKKMLISLFQQFSNFL